MSQPVTTTQIRQNVVNEAIARATRECVFLFVYEYQGTISDNTTWATLLEGEQPPKDSLLLCTVNQDGVVDWKIDEPDLIQAAIANAPIEEVTFNNVSITIGATHPAAAYTLLCEAPTRFEYTTDTFQTHGAAGESEEQSTTVLFPSQSAPNHAQSPNAALEILTERELLLFIVEFCSERLEWFCGGCYRDSAEVVWLENARSQLGYPPLDFTGITFTQKAPSAEPSKLPWFVIQSREAAEEHGKWEEWDRDTNPAHLLRAFVNSVSSEEIDDVNRYWRVRETLDPDNLTNDDEVITNIS